MLRSMRLAIMGLSWPLLHAGALRGVHQREAPVRPLYYEGVLLLREMCFPDASSIMYATCNPATGRDSGVLCQNHVLASGCQAYTWLRSSNGAFPRLLAAKRKAHEEACVSGGSGASASGAGRRGPVQDRMLSAACTCSGPRLAHVGRPTWMGLGSSERAAWDASGTGGEGAQPGGCRH